MCYLKAAWLQKWLSRVLNKEPVELPSNVVYANDSGHRFVFRRAAFGRHPNKGVAKKALMAGDPVP